MSKTKHTDGKSDKKKVDSQPPQAGKQSAQPASSVPPNPDPSPRDSAARDSAARDRAALTPRVYSRRRVQFGLMVTLLGFVVFLIGVRPDVFTLDRSPIIGFVQIAMFLIGLAIMCLGGYSSLMALWKNSPTSIAVDFGVRMVATGFVIAVFSGMADVFGFGSHVPPAVPFFGPWQARGVFVGQMVIAIGFMLLIPYSDPGLQKIKTFTQRSLQKK